MSAEIGTVGVCGAGSGIAARITIVAAGAGHRVAPARRAAVATARRETN